MATSPLIRALRRPLPQAGTLLQLVQKELFVTKAMHGKGQAVTGYQHLNSRNLSILFSKQLKGEAKSTPEFVKSMKDLNGRFGSVSHDLKVRANKTTEKIYKSTDYVWTEVEATSNSKKVSVNVKQKLSVTKEEIKRIARPWKEEICQDGSPKTSIHKKPNVSSHPNDGIYDAANSATLFSTLKSTVSSASPAVSSAFAKWNARISTFVKQGYDIIKDELSSGRNKKNHFQHPSIASVERSTRTDIVVVPTKKSMLGEKWESFKNKMWGHPVYKTVSEYTKPVVTIGQEVAEDVRERWETSDSPLVHKIQDLNDSFFEETATAVSYREIRRRDPSFSLPDFVADIEEAIKPVLIAYSKGDKETLKKYCSNEVIERCEGERQAYASHNMFFRNKVLHISEPHVIEAKMLGSTPLIILGIHCVHNRDGKITDGGQDTIKTVYYHWAMQLMDSDELPEAESYYPVWRLREMQQVDVKALI